MASIELIQAVAATAELCGANLTDAAARMLIADLSAYPEADVMTALSRVRRKSKRFSLGAIIEEIDASDQRPGADAAWAMIPRSESQSVVWTREIAEAFGIASPLLEIGDKFGAQRAFKEEYTRLCDAARSRGEPVQWEASLGHDPAGREQVIREAIEKKRLPPGAAVTMLPAPDMTKSPIVALIGRDVPMIEGETAKPMDPEVAREKLAELKALLQRNESK